MQIWTNYETHIFKKWGNVPSQSQFRQCKYERKCFEHCRQFRQFTFTRLSLYCSAVCVLRRWLASTIELRDLNVRKHAMTADKPLVNRPGRALVNPTRSDPLDWIYFQARAWCRPWRAGHLHRGYALWVLTFEVKANSTARRCHHSSKPTAHEQRKG